MKILFVISGFNTGGAELMLAKLASRLNKKNFQCEIANLGSAGVAQEQTDVPVENFNSSSLLRLPFAFSRLKKKIKTFNPDLIQGWMYNGNIAASLVADSTPVLWGIRYSLTDRKTEKWLTRLIINLSSSLSNSPKKIIFNSYVSRDHHQKLGYPTEKTTIIPNGVECEKWKPNPDSKINLRKELKLRTNTPLIGIVGRFHPEKDQGTFLKAAGLLSQKNSEAHFVLVGPGNNAENKILKNQLDKLFLQNRCHLLGERKDISHIMAGLDILTISSRTEALPNVLLEGMASGLVCVGSDVGDISRVLNGTGFTFPVQNFETLSDQWNKLLILSKEKREAIGLKAREHVKREYGLDKMIEEFNSIYQSFSKQP